MSRDEQLIHDALLREWPLPRSDGDKNDKGRLLIVGGATQTPGAVSLAAEAALRSGAGKVQIATAGTVAAPVAAALPEVYVERLPVLYTGDIAASAAEQVVEMAAEVDAVLLGPGFNDPEAAADLLRRVVPRLETPVVIDALATAFLTGNLDGVRHLQGAAVLTPNVTELAATLGREQHRLGDVREATAELAAASRAVVLSGATPSFVVDPDGRTWRNDTEVAGLACAGSGDVKAGCVAALLARGAEPAQAAVWGSHLHAQAGVRLARAVAPVGFLARELLGELPAVQARLAEVQPAARG